ncbi:MAG: dipeptide epimerase [Spirochaetales bacterium]|jgi:L-alanine-DL-glutamate epimerase-like enolase superfamily enzyme|nr:dipeptide epimerase [Spirochaetales bacterium]
MRITNAEVWRMDIPLSVPYTIAYETYTESKTVFLRIETSSGLTGFGAATPDSYVTGENAAEVEQLCRSSCIPILKNSDPLRYAKTMDIIGKQISGHPSTKALVDMALHDLLGKVAGIPVWKLLGGYRSKIETSVTVGILSPEKTAKSIQNLLNQGIKIIKLKGGLDLEQDLATLNHIAETFGKSIVLRFDANQGYTHQQTLYFITHYPAGLQLEILEQPVPFDQHRQLGLITKHSPVPIMADESVASLQDAYHLVRHNLVDMINIKLMKSGGIANGLHINSVARASGTEVMVGCMDECQLGIAAGLHFTLSRPNIRFADLDGFMDLEDDPTAGCIHMKKGFLYPSSSPGLGLKTLL